MKNCPLTYVTLTPLRYNIEEYKEDINTWGIVLDVALTILPILFIILFFSWVMKQASAANNQSLGFGKSRAKLYGPDKKKVSFKDVAGNEAAKQDLTEIVDFLKKQQGKKIIAFLSLGRKMPLCLKMLHSIKRMI